MSMILIAQAMKLKLGNSARKFVLIKLADNANDNAECWPSYQHIADHCELGRSTVKAHIKQLESDGFIKVVERNNGKSSNKYILTLDKGSERERRKPVRTHNVQPGHVSTGSTADTGCTAADRPLAQPLTPEPIIEAIKEPITLPPNGSASGDAGVQELELNEPLNTDQPGLKENGSSAPDKVINIPFEDWWTIYGKKVDRKKCERKWNKLSNKTRLAIIEHTPKYVRATPETEYRKNPYTYLNSETWNDEQLPVRSQGWPNASYPTNQNNTTVDVDAAMAPRAVRRQESTPEQLKRNQEQAANLLNMFKGG